MGTQGFEPRLPKKGNAVLQTGAANRNPPDAHMAETLGIEPSRVLPLGALAPRWLAICLGLRNLAGVEGVEPSIAVLEAATVTVRSLP